MKTIGVESFRRHIDEHYPFDKEGQSESFQYDLAKSALLLLLENEPSVEVFDDEREEHLMDVSIHKVRNCSGVNLHSVY